MVDRKVVNFALWTCVVMLALAPLSGWPYGYYTLLRWVVFLTTGYLTYENYQKGHKGFSFILGAAALLFNPIAPVHLSKSGWAPIDLVVAGFLLVYVLRGKSIRLKLEKKLWKKLLLWGGVSVCFLLVWGFWSQHRYETHDYPISLVTSRTNFKPEEYLKSLTGELTVHGWHVQSVDAPGTYLVSFTYSKPPGPLLKALRASRLNLATLPDQPATRKETAGIATPSTWGWWWEVNASVPLVRTVTGDPNLEKKYGLVPSQTPIAPRRPPETMQLTMLTPDELKQIQATGLIKEEGGGQDQLGILWVPSRYLLLTIKNGTKWTITSIQVNLSFYDGQYLISRNALHTYPIFGTPTPLAREILQAGETGNYKIAINDIYPSQQATRYELEFDSAAPTNKYQTVQF